MHAGRKRAARRSEGQDRPGLRAALYLVSRGEAPLGIVYSTDAKSDPKVKVLDYFP